MKKNQHSKKSESFRQKLFYSNQPSFIEVIKERIAQLRKTERNGTADTYTTTLRSFQRFCNGCEPRIGQITSNLIQQYETWLHSSGVKKNSSSFYLRVLRAVYHYATGSTTHLLDNPFKNVYTGVDKTMKRAISMKDIRRICDINLSAHPSMDFARDMFMFSFYTRGMAFVDMAYLQTENLRNGYLIYNRMKTGQKLQIKWEPCMEQIIKKYGITRTKQNKKNNLNRYLLPIITNEESQRKQYKNKLHAVNEQLKKLAVMMNLPPITMYVARHSWATIAYSRNIPLSIISEGMGHDSEKTTRIYLASIHHEEVDCANLQIINALNNIET